MIGLLQNKAVGPGLQTPDRKGLDNGTLSEPYIQTPPPLALSHAAMPAGDVIDKKNATSEKLCGHTGTPAIISRNCSSVSSGLVTRSQAVIRLARTPVVKKLVPRAAKFQVGVPDLAQHRS